MRSTTSILFTTLLALMASTTFALPHLKNSRDFNPEASYAERNFFGGGGGGGPGSGSGFGGGGGGFNEDDTGFNFEPPSDPSTTPPTTGGGDTPRPNTGDLTPEQIEAEEGVLSGGRMAVKLFGVTEVCILTARRGPH